MKPQAYLTHQELAVIETRARRMRAEATAEAFSAVRNWVRNHLHLGSAHKA